MKSTYSKTVSEDKKKSSRRTVNIAEIDVTEVDNGIAQVTRVFVPPEYRQTGIGSVLMNDVINDADNECVTLIVEPRPYIDRSEESYNKLKKFYNKFGFVYKDNDYMIRIPNCKQKK